MCTTLSPKSIREDFLGQGYLERLAMNQADALEPLMELEQKVDHPFLRREPPHAHEVVVEALLPSKRRVPASGVGRQPRLAVHDLEPRERDDAAGADASSAARLDGVAGEKKRENLSPAVREDTQLASPARDDDQLLFRTGALALSNLRPGVVMLDAAPECADALNVRDLYRLNITQGRCLE
jgi:hypothetical protein